MFAEMTKQPMKRQDVAESIFYQRQNFQYFTAFELMVDEDAPAVLDLKQTGVTANIVTNWG